MVYLEFYLRNIMLLHLTCLSLPRKEESTFLATIVAHFFWAWSHIWPQLLAEFGAIQLHAMINDRQQQTEMVNTKSMIKILSAQFYVTLSKTCLSLPMKVETTFLATIVADLYLSVEVTARSQRTTIKKI